MLDEDVRKEQRPQACIGLNEGVSYRACVRIRKRCPSRITPGCKATTGSTIVKSCPPELKEFHTDSTGHRNGWHESQRYSDEIAI
jgi:hypothetical protein